MPFLTAGGNVKKFNSKRFPGSSSQCNGTAPMSGLNYPCAKEEGGSLSAWFPLSPSPL